jgi:histone arginine demethylase JMJD6
VVKGSEVIGKGEDDEATNYFIDIVPRIKHKYREGYVSGAGGLQQLRFIEFIQQEGDTVFIPGGLAQSISTLHCY